MSTTQQGFPNAGTPFVDAQGRITQPWYQTLIALWNRTGGSPGQTINEFVTQLLTLDASPGVPFPTPDPALVMGAGLPPDLRDLLVVAALTQRARGTASGANTGKSGHVVPFMDQDGTWGGIQTFAGQLIGKGTTTNDSAPAGFIGEYISSSVSDGSAVALVTNVAKDVTSISLTAGDWDVGGNVTFVPNIATVPTEYSAWISITSATIPARPNGGMVTQLLGSFSTGTAAVMGVPTGRISLAAPATVYLSGLSIFTTSTMAAGGFIGARRPR